LEERGPYKAEVPGSIPGPPTTEIFGHFYGFSPAPPNCLGGMGNLHPLSHGDDLDALGSAPDMICDACRQLGGLGKGKA
jgi:hypothetical protein